MRFALLIILIFQFTTNYGQDLKQRNIFGFIPTSNSRINGIGLGPIINNFKSSNNNKIDVEINGLCIEIIGVGLLLPLVGSDPILLEADSVYNDINKVDSIAKSYNYAKYRINGVAISASGIAGNNININGLNLSGLNTLTSKMNGVSTAIMYNLSGVMNGVCIGGLANGTLKTKGVQIGIFNSTKLLKGLQIGLFNSTYHMKGVQIGLWNSNSKRKLPLINWQFK